MICIAMQRVRIKVRGTVKVRVYGKRDYRKWDVALSLIVTTFSYKLLLTLTHIIFIINRANSAGKPEMLNQH